MFDLGGLDKGLKKGLDYQAKYYRLLQWAVKTNNHECLTACANIAGIWAGEVLDSKGLVKSNIAILMLTGDPFAGSRKAVQDALAAFPQSGVK